MYAENKAGIQSVNFFMVYMLGFIRSLFSINLQSQGPV